MDIDFDPAKDRQNLVDHKVSLSFAAMLAWDEGLVWLDRRFDYDELRMVALVPEGNRLYYVAYVDRGALRRIISLRFATKSETAYYVENYTQTPD